MQIQTFKTIQMQICTIWTRFEAFEGIFQVFEKDSNHSKPNSNHSNEIRSIECNSNHSKGILTIRIQIRTIQTRFEAF